MALAVLTRLRRSAVTLPLAVLAAVAAIGFNESAYKSSMNSLDGQVQRDPARMHIRNVQGRLIDAETGQRGFLLTERADYLDPYRRAANDVNSSLDWLEKYYRDDATPLKLVGDIRARAVAKLSELETTIRLQQEGRHEAWRELTLTDIGREQMVEIRDLSAALLDVELQRVARDRDHIYRTLSNGRIGQNGLILVILLALVFFLRQSRMFDAAQRANADALQAERDNLEAEVVHRTAELTELTRHLQTVREDERSHIARNLHDELGALLTAAKLDAARLKRGIGTLTPEAETRLQHLNDTINQGISLKRTIIEDLRPSALNSLGLVPALEIQAREFSERAEVPVQTDLQDLPLGDAAQITIYRVVQESLTNIAKYAGAVAVQISLKREGDRAHVSVRDDGCGFDTARPRPQGHGLLGMRYRAEAEGGTLRVTSMPGKGTRVDVWLPVRASKPTIVALG